MAPDRPAAQERFAERLAVETPEHVSLQFELAGLGSRAAAAIYDAVVVAGILLLIVIASAATGLLSAAGSWFDAVALLAGFVVLWGYYVLSEGLANGRTLGKREMGIRVVMDTGHPLTFAASAVRNLVRLVDAQPAVSYVVGGAFVLFHPQHKRLGDLVAGTVVVRDRPGDRRLAPVAARAESLVPMPAPALADDEFRLLSQFLARRELLAPEARTRLTGELVVRFAGRYPRRPSGPETFLTWLLEEETQRRQRATSNRPAIRFVARKQASWERFRDRAARAEREGLAGLDGDAVLGFAAGYRELAADLARARTLGVDARVVEYLERTVSAGHNALYGLRGARRFSVVRWLTRDLPGEVVRSRG